MRSDTERELCIVALVAAIFFSGYLVSWFLWVFLPDFFRQYVR